MNRDAARSAERPEKNKTPVEEIRDVLTKEGLPNGRCILRFATLAEPVQWFLSSHPAINPFIAAIATNQKDNNIKILETQKILRAEGRRRVFFYNLTSNLFLKDLQSVSIYSNFNFRVSIQ
jgi:hypothetical protein